MAALSKFNFNNCTLKGLQIVKGLLLAFVQISKVGTAQKTALTPFVNRTVLCDTQSFKIIGLHCGKLLKRTLGTGTDDNQTTLYITSMSQKILKNRPDSTFSG